MIECLLNDQITPAIARLEATASLSCPTGKSR